MFRIEDSKHNPATNKKGEPFVYSSRALAHIAAKVMKNYLNTKFWVVEL